MGNNNSQEHYNVTRPLAPEWQKVIINEYTTVLRNDSTGEQAELYHNVRAQDSIARELDIYEYRNQQATSKNILGVHYAQQANPDDMTLCAGDEERMSVVTERIPSLLAEVPPLPQSQGMYVLHQSLIGFEELYSRQGYFPINDRMIGFNCKGNVRVWLNENYESNHVKANPMLNYGEQSFPESEEESRMVLQLVNIVQNHCQGRFSPQFHSQLQSIAPANFPAVMDLVNKHTTQQNVHVAASLSYNSAVSTIYKNGSLNSIPQTNTSSPIVYTTTSKIQKPSVTVNPPLTSTIAKVVQPEYKVVETVRRIEKLGSIPNILNQPSTAQVITKSAVQQKPVTAVPLSSQSINPVGSQVTARVNNPPHTSTPVNRTSIMIEARKPLTSNPNPSGPVPTMPGQIQYIQRPRNPSFLRAAPVVQNIPIMANFPIITSESAPAVIRLKDTPNVIIRQPKNTQQEAVRIEIPSSQKSLVENLGIGNVQVTETNLFNKQPSVGKLFDTPSKYVKQGEAGQDDSRAQRIKESIRKINDIFEEVSGSKPLTYAVPPSNPVAFSFNIKPTVEQQTTQHPAPVAISSVHNSIPAAVNSSIEQPSIFSNVVTNIQIQRPAVRIVRPADVYKTVSVSIGKSSQVTDAQVSSNQHHEYTVQIAQQQEKIIKEQEKLMQRQQAIQDKFVRQEKAGTEAQRSQASKNQQRSEGQNKTEAYEEMRQVVTDFATQTQIPQAVQVKRQQAAVITEQTAVRNYEEAPHARIQGQNSYQNLRQFTFESEYYNHVPRQQETHDQVPSDTRKIEHGNKIQQTGTLSVSEETKRLLYGETYNNDKHVRFEQDPDIKSYEMGSGKLMSDSSSKEFAGYSYQAEKKAQPVQFDNYYENKYSSDYRAEYKPYQYTSEVPTSNYEYNYECKYGTNNQEYTSNNNYGTSSKISYEDIIAKYTGKGTYKDKSNGAQNSFNRDYASGRSRQEEPLVVFNKQSIHQGGSRSRIDDLEVSRGKSTISYSELRKRLLDL